MQTEFQYIKVNKNGEVAEIVINNSGKANCLNRQLWFELPMAVKMLDDDLLIKVGILSSTGKHFSSGIDLNLLKQIMSEINSLPQSQRAPQLKRIILEMQNAFSSFEQSRIPWIAAIHGLCLGGAIDLISACDLRFGTVFSTYSILETRLGIVADMGTIQRLQRVIPEGRFKELLYTSGFFFGFSAWRYGLLNRIFLTRRSMKSAAYKLARKIAALPDFAVAGAKRSFNYSRDHRVDEGLEHIAELNSGLLLDERSQHFFKQNFK